MKFIYITAVLALICPLQVASAETLSLEAIIDHAIENSPETNRILNEVTDLQSEAFDIEALENPTAEINVKAIKDGDDSRTAEIEIEQPLKISNFGSRGLYADALRQTAKVEQKAMMLELMHSVTRAYASYWVLQEQEKILAASADYIRQKQKLIENAANEGLVDVTDANIFKAEGLRLNEHLRVVRARKKSGGVNLLKMAGMEQRVFDTSRPKSPNIPNLNVLTELAGNEGGVTSLLEARKALAERRYAVAVQDAGLSELSPRAVIERDFDEDNTTVMFGVGLSLPIWDRNNAEIARAKAERRLAQSNLNALNEHNFANVLAAAYEQAKATQISALTYKNQIVPSWQDVQVLLDKKFENGQASILDLFQMRERVTDVHGEALQAYLNSIEARIELESLIGQSLFEIKE